LPERLSLSSASHDSSHANTALDTLTVSGRIAGIPFHDIEIPAVEIPEQFLYEREELILGLSFALARAPAPTARSWTAFDRSGQFVGKEL